MKDEKEADQGRKQGKQEQRPSGEKILETERSLWLELSKSRTKIVT